MKWFGTILLFGILSLIWCLPAVAQQEFPTPIFFDSVKILPPATVFQLNTNKDTGMAALELSYYLDNRFSVGLATGYSGLKVVPNWGVKNLSPKLPRIGMRETFLRFRWRPYFDEGLSVILEATAGMSNGTLHYRYSDTNIIISSSDNPVKYKSGDWLHIREDVNVSNTIIGGSVGFSSPLYFRSKSNKILLSPRAVLINFKVGADVLALRVDHHNEIPYISYSRSLEGGDIQEGGIFGEIVTAGDWVLFYFGLGVDYLIDRNVMFNIEATIGAYPVSGPATIESDAVTTADLPDTWGGDRAIRIGFEILL